MTTRTQRRASARQHAAQEPSRTTDEWVKVADLRPMHMRPTSRTKVRQITQELDPDALGVLYVSQHADGSKWILDGNNRHAALVQLGWEDQKVPCHVYHGLTKEREHALFVEYNQNRTKPKPIDIFLNKVEAGDPTAVAVQKVLDSHGLEVNKAQGWGHVMAVLHFQRVVEQTNPSVFSQTLRVLTNAWGKHSTSYQGDLVTGIAVLLSRYPKAIDQDRLSSKLTNMTADQLLAQSRMLKQVEHSGAADHSSTSYVARTVVGLYNSGLRTENRLSWQDRMAAQYWVPEPEAKS